MLYIQARRGSMRICWQVRRKSGAAKCARERNRVQRVPLSSCALCVRVRGVALDVCFEKRTH